jgi:pyroglutamyl-peptidase
MTATLLVTGFERFGTHADNPTAEAVRALARAGSFEGRAAFAVLPVTYGGAFAVLRARAERERVRACLLFGLGNRPAVCVERAAYNATEAAVADNAGDVRAGAPLREGGVDAVQTRGPLEAVRDALAGAGAPVVLSDDPGRYVCNATYYRVLTAEAPWAPASLFVHVPPTEALGGKYPQRALEQWVSAAVSAALDAHEALDAAAHK